MITINPLKPYIYYLTDHLGSSSYITDDRGSVTQTMAYLPFGESWVDITHNNPAYETTYKFTGKEKDEETGFNYFGARYYYDELSIWLSVDPMAHKYPSLSPYNYCANNPIKYIDPDGMKIDPASKAEWKNQRRRLKQLRNNEYPGVKKEAIRRTLKTMSTLKKSKQMYSLNKNDEGINKTSLVQNEDGSYTIQFSFDCEGGLTHELVHGQQFEDRKLGFDKTSKKPLAYDIFDEIEAFTVQGKAFPDSLPDELKKDGKLNINEGTVKSLKNSEGNKPYIGLPSEEKNKSDIKNSENNYFKQ